MSIRPETGDKDQFHRQRLAAHNCSKVVYGTLGLTIVAMFPDLQRTRIRVHPTSFIDHGKLVRIIGGSGANQFCDQGCFPGETSSGNQNGRPCPTYHPTMDKGTLPASLGYVQRHHRVEALQKLPKVSAGEQQSAVSSKPVPWSGCRL